MKTIVILYRYTYICHLYGKYHASNTRGIEKRSNALS